MPNQHQHYNLRCKQSTCISDNNMHGKRKRQWPKQSRKQKKLKGKEQKTN